MYGETTATIRAELTALLRKRRVQRLLGATVAERRGHGQQIQSHRHVLLTWATHTMRNALPMTFSNLPPRHPNPFHAENTHGAAIDLARSLEHATTHRGTARDTTGSLSTPSQNPVVEHWRRTARAATLAEHDTSQAVAGRLSAAQARTLVADVAAITQALVLLDERYRNTPDWVPLRQGRRLGWSALAAALDAQLGQPDYSLDNLGWSPRAKKMRGTAKPGILGVLQAEHNVLVGLRAFPNVINLRLAVDSQRLVSGQLAPAATRIDPDTGRRWQDRASTYATIRRDLRDLGSLLGTGELAAAEAATLASRLDRLPDDAVLEPRALRAFQTLFTQIDHRIVDIIDESVDRGAFAQRVSLPELDSDARQLVHAPLQRFQPVTQGNALAVVRTVHQRLRPTCAATRGSGPSRAELHAALIHQPPRRGTPTEPPRL